MRYFAEMTPSRGLIPVREWDQGTVEVTAEALLGLFAGHRGRYQSKDRIAMISELIMSAPGGDPWTSSAPSVLAAHETFFQKTYDLGIVTSEARMVMMAGQFMSEVNDDWLKAPATCFIGNLNDGISVVLVNAWLMS